ncbi:MAG: glycosyltransferase family 2 protein [Chloroflexota bacterium]
MPTLSIVIVNYNTREKLRECLESILEHKGSLDVETLVVDNGSVDGSAEMVREFEPDITLVDPQRNTWFSGGNNLGAETATGKYVWILNPDTIVQPDTMQKMVAYLEANPQVGVVTCLMQFPDYTYQQTCSRTPRYIDLLLGYTLTGAIFMQYRDKRRGEMFYGNWQRDSIKSIDVAPGSNMLFRRAVYQEHGGFDTQMRLYFVEDDLCRRVIDAGHEVHFLPDALLLHHEHASVQQVQRLASQIYFDDLIVFCRKHYGILGALFLRLLIVPTRWGMALKQRLRGEKVALSS